MPYSRPLLSDLQTQVAQDIASAVPGSDPLLRFSNLGILGNVLAGLAHLHYGYLDWISKQAVPFTATEEFLESWAALKGVFRIPATQASGQITFSGLVGTPIPAGTPIARGDGVQFTSTADATVAIGGSAVVSAIANADPTGLTGAFGNTAVGVAMTLGTSIPGIQSSGSVSTAFTGGADLETDDSLRARTLQAYQNPLQGGTQSDYQQWALQVPGVTRAWCNPSGYGSGSVVVYIMLDLVEAAHNGFPQGTDGVATAETRGIAATGDQLAIANYMYDLRPCTALVYVSSPLANPINFTISGLSTASASTKTSISQAIAGVLQQNGSPLNGTVELSLIESAIATIPGIAGFVITSPTANITGTMGQLPTLGTVTYI